jgi:hypothetical protein
MLFFDTNRKEMADMNISEKIRINFKAMQLSNILGTPKFIALVVFFVLLSNVVLAVVWIKTGLATVSFVAVAFVFFICLITINLIFKPYYAPFIDEALKHKESVLGSEEQRKINNKKRSVQLLILAVALPLIQVAIFIVF